MSLISAENLNRLASVADKTLTQADTFPYTFEKPAVGLDILNSDSTTSLIITLTTRKNEEIGPFIIPAGEALSEEFEPIKIIDVSQTTTEFYIVVRKTLEV